MGGRRTSTSQADWWQHLLQDSSVAEALLLREQVLAVDVDMLESWDFDVFFYTREQLIAHLCVMAMRLGFTQLEVRASPSFGDHWQAVQEPSLGLLASSPFYLVQHTTLRACSLLSMSGRPAQKPTQPTLHQLEQRTAASCWARCCSAGHRWSLQRRCGVRARPALPTPRHACWHALASWRLSPALPTGPALCRWSSSGASSPR